MTVKQITTGQDSFLDIVANLVGILIILVVIVGAQAKVAWKFESVEQESLEDVTAIDQQLSTVAAQARKLELDNLELQALVAQQVLTAQELGEQRHQLLVEIEMAKQELAQAQTSRQAELDQQQQELWAAREKEQQLLNELLAIQKSTEALEHLNAPKTDVIEHFPNPIAKTVFSEEVHFQLRKGKIVYVPMDELLSRMKSEWKDQAEKLRNQSAVTGTVGPLRNFRLQYELIAHTIPQPGQPGQPGGGRIMIQFNGFQLFPASENLGATVAEALNEDQVMGSEFIYHLRRYPASKTTVSLWVYPDSFSEYNQIKKWLYDNGYQVACWPLSHDKWIAGGPGGFRTSAQ